MHVRDVPESNREINASARDPGSPRYIRVHNPKIFSARHGPTEPQLSLLLSLIGVRYGLLMPVPMTPSACGRRTSLNGRSGRMVDVLEVLRDSRVGSVRTGLRVGGRDQ
jgi:hypothetical protein